MKRENYRSEKPVPNDRIVNKRVHDQVGVSGTNCAHWLDHWGPQLSGWDYILTHQLVLVCYQSVINLLSMMTFLDHLLGPCVANVNHEKCCVRHDQPDSYRWWDNIINEHFVFGVTLNRLSWQIDCRQVKDFSAHQVWSLFGSEQGHSNSPP